MNAHRTMKALASRYGSKWRLRYRRGESKAARIERSRKKHRNEG